MGSLSRSPLCCGSLKFVPGKNCYSFQSSFLERPKFGEYSGSALKLPLSFSVFQRPGVLLPLQPKIFKRKSRCVLDHGNAAAKFPSAVARGGEVGEGAKKEDVLLSPGPGLYTPFVDHCVQEMKKRMDVWPFPMQERFRELQGQHGPKQRAVSRSTAYQSRKIRQMRAADISAGPKLQVLNLVIFPRPEYDLPYFCADLVSFPRGHLIVLDLNPLHPSEEYLERHIRPVLPLCHKHAQVLPWGGEFTAESLQFFSPALLWARLPLTQDVCAAVLPAFKDYLQVWLDMLDAVEPEQDEQKIAANRESQHRYVCWRLQKDPGRPVLTRLFGEELCEEYIEEFLFDGLHTLGNKTFLDYFPEYRAADGSVSKKRSMAGKSYSTRPWDEDGRLRH